MTSTQNSPIREHVRRIVDAAPPLTDTQRHRLARLLTASTPARKAG